MVVWCAVRCVRQRPWSIGVPPSDTVPVHASLGAVGSGVPGDVTLGRAEIADKSDADGAWELLAAVGGLRPETQPVVLNFNRLCDPGNVGVEEEVVRMVWWGGQLGGGGGGGWWGMGEGGLWG